MAAKKRTPDAAHLDELGSWKSRIEGLEDVDPKLLKPHPDNPKVRASDAQRSMLIEAITTLGWLKPIIASARSRRIVNGHLRREVAIELELPTVPVIWLDITEMEELELLATLDPIRDMAASHPDRLRTLLEDMRALTPNFDTFRPIMPSVSAAAGPGASTVNAHLIFEQVDSMQLYQRFAAMLIAAYPNITNSGSRIIAWLRDNGHA